MIENYSFTVFGPRFRQYVAILPVETVTKTPNPLTQKLNLASKITAIQHRTMLRFWMDHEM